MLKIFQEFGVSFITHLNKGIEGLDVNVGLLEVILDLKSVLEDPRIGWSHFAAAEPSISICGALGD